MMTMMTGRAARLPFRKRVDEAEDAAFVPTPARRKDGNQPSLSALPDYLAAMNAVSASGQIGLPPTVAAYRLPEGYRHYGASPGAWQTGVSCLVRPEAPGISGILLTLSAGRPPALLGDGITILLGSQGGPLVCRTGQHPFFLTQETPPAQAAQALEMMQTAAYWAEDGGDVRPLGTPRPSRRFTHINPSDWRQN